MAYTRDDYLKDCLIASQGSGRVRAEAKLRADWYELGRISRIEEKFPEFSSASVSAASGSSYSDSDYWILLTSLPPCSSLFGKDHMQARDFVIHIADLCSGVRVSSNDDELRLAYEIQSQAMLANNAFNRGDMSQLTSIENNLETLLRQYKQAYYVGSSRNTSTSYRSSSSGGSSGGCYIATSIYGSYDCPQVWTLRRYRDEILATTWYGRAFVKTYYATSPTLVRWFGDSRLFREFIGKRLDAMVGTLQRRGFACTPYEDRVW